MKVGDLVSCPKYVRKGHDAYRIGIILHMWMCGYENSVQNCNVYWLYAGYTYDCFASVLEVIDAKR